MVTWLRKVVAGSFLRDLHSTAMDRIGWTHAQLAMRIGIEYSDTVESRVRFMSRE